MSTLQALCLAWLISMVANIIVMLWFIDRHLEPLEKKLTGCLCIDEIRTSLKYGGVIGRHIRFNIVFMVIYMPGILYRRGLISKDANLNIPHDLKLKIWGIYAWLFANGTAMAALYYIIKTSK